MRDWVAGARPRTLGAAIVPVAVGTAAAADPQVLNAGLAFAVALLLQLAVNFANDYSDGVRGVDTPQRVGPTRLVASGLKSASAVRNVAFGCAALAAVAGLVLSLRENPWLIAVGVLALIATFTYAGGPRPYASLGLGELAVIVFFGVVPTVGTAYVQGHVVFGSTWAIGLGCGFWAAAILEANNLRDVPTDMRAGKRTIAVRFGPGFARHLIGVFFVATALTVVWAGLVSPIPVRAFSPLAVIAFVMFLVGRQVNGTATDLIRVLKTIASYELIFGFALVAEIVFARL